MLPSYRRSLCHLKSSLNSAVVLIKLVGVVACVPAATNMPWSFASELEEGVCSDSCYYIMYKSQVRLCRGQCNRAMLKRIGEACWRKITCKCTLDMLAVAPRASEELNGLEAQK